MTAIIKSFIKTEWETDSCPCGWPLERGDDCFYIAEHGNIFAGPYCCKKHAREEWGNLPVRCEL